MRKIILASVMALTAAANAVTFNGTVPGTSDPWLAGMPDGSTASINDVAPFQSPVAVSGVTISGGAVLNWNASGIVGHPGDEAGPDGYTAAVWSHANGAENGISDIVAPIDSLLGVFLGPGQPDSLPAPGFLDFSSVASQDYASLAPALQQVFFMGDGLAGGILPQSIIAPAGATRLFLGTMDGYEWNNNVGEFQVTIRGIQSVPDASSSLALLGGAFALMGALGRKFRK